MFYIKKTLLSLLVAVSLSQGHCDTSANQTDTLSAIYPGSKLPFTLGMTTAGFQIPGGLQTFAFAVYGDKVLCVAGRTNGLHGFEGGDDNFPPNQQNTNLFVINLKKQTVSSRSLLDARSGLTQTQVDYLSVTAPEYKQVGNTLYVVGGYGVDTATGEFSTKQVLSALDVPGLIAWVENPDSDKKAVSYVRQIHNPIFRVTGGALEQANAHDPFLLIFGQDFEGYYTDGSNGAYTQQVRTFKLFDNGTHLTVFDESYLPAHSYYRRRDLNVVPIVQPFQRSYDISFMALSGVFTLETGVWTVPVFIDASGKSFMPNPNKNSTFKQAMNNYNSAKFGLFSKKTGHMHTLLLGGISYQTCSDGTCSTDAEIPFTNNITDVVLKPNGTMKQYLLDTEYPVIYSNVFSPPRQLLFGAGAVFVPSNKLPAFAPSVLSLDAVKKKTLVGYIIGGIMSSLPNTNDQGDSAASPYIFEVYVTPR